MTETKELHGNSYSKKIINYQKKMCLSRCFHIKDALKNYIQELVADSNSSILNGNLKAFLYLVKIDEDFSLLKRGIQKLELQLSPDQLARASSLQTPLMRLMYIQDRTDQALELFMSDVIETN